MTMEEALDMAEAAHPPLPRTVYVVMWKRESTGDYLEYSGEDSRKDCVCAYLNKKIANEYITNIREEIDKLNSIKLMTYEKYAHSLAVKSLSWDQRRDIERSNKDIIKKAILETDDFPLLKTLRGFIKFCEEFYEESGMFVASETADKMDRKPDTEFYIQEVKLIT